jgi:hypothetical protein
MSWEGDYQHLCKKGHYTSKSAEYQDADEKCINCGEKIVWVNIMVLMIMMEIELMDMLSQKSIKKRSVKNVDIHLK